MTEEIGDYDLLQRWGTGDKAAGNQLVRRHFRTVHRFFRSKLEEGVDDLTQRTFIACMEGYANFQPDSSLRSYLLGIARNMLRMHFRSTMRREKYTQDFFSTVSVAELRPTLSQVFATHEAHQLLLVALRQIPIDLQIALELFYREDLTTREIAQVLEIPEGTVKSRLSRAKDMLRARLHEIPAPEPAKTTIINNLEEVARMDPTEPPSEPTSEEG